MESFTLLANRITVLRLDAIGTGSLSSADCIEALRRHADSFSTVLDGDLMEQSLGLFC